MGDRTLSLILVFLLSIALATGFNKVIASETKLTVTQDYQWNLPTWTPKPVVPEDNPMTAAKVEL